jgi:sirohydrochlorin ferrochelatase
MENKIFNLYIFHGSARPDALISAQNFLKKVKSKMQNEGIGICFLRGGQPDLRTALTQAANSGYKNFKIIQLFLLPGAHVNEDIPGETEKFCQEFPGTSIKILPCLVELDDFVNLMANLADN